MLPQLVVKHTHRVTASRRRWPTRTSDALLECYPTHRPHLGIGVHLPIGHINNEAGPGLAPSTRDPSASVGTVTTLDKTFRMVRFTPEVMTFALDRFEAIAGAWATAKEVDRSWFEREGSWTYIDRMRVKLPDGESWIHDDLGSFLNDVHKPDSAANLSVWSAVPGARFQLDVETYDDMSRVSVTAPDPSVVHEVMEIFRSRAAVCTVSPTPSPAPAKPRIFIGHGGASRHWLELQNHLTNQHGYEVEAYETGARAGHHIRDVLERMLSASSFALLVLTAEDEQADGEMRARQNVVHEAGLFQGRLGFSRAVLLVEDGVEGFSNVDGVQHIPFPPGNIRATYGDVLATLRREFYTGDHS